MDVNTAVTKELHDRFEAIKAHYRPHMAEMVACGNDWAIDPYAWDDGKSGISLTPIERALWADIRSEDVVMYPQYPVGPFFVDFGNPFARVAIECDGRRWHTDKAKDAARDRALHAMGWEVYRIGGRECLTDSIEHEDDDGNAVFEISMARRFVQSVCVAHPSVRRDTRHRDQGHVQLGDSMLRHLGRITGRVSR